MNAGEMHISTKRIDVTSKNFAWMLYLNTVTDGGGTYFDNYDRTMNAVQGR